MTGRIGRNRSWQQGPKEIALSITDSRDPWSLMTELPTHAPMKGAGSDKSSTEITEVQKIKIHFGQRMVNHHDRKCLLRLSIPATESAINVTFVM